MSRRKKIVVAMSGGVDSSTVAAMLHSLGHEVIGVTLQLYDAQKVPINTKTCCAGQDIYDAQIAAQKIGIPHYVLDYQSIFSQEVIEDFVDSYIRGETPIPCVKCNQTVKFRDLLKVARDLGADELATGHYVQKKNIDGYEVMLKGADQKKDQSYFLLNTTREQLSYLNFPIGHMDKSETRELAHYYGLEVATKNDSQDICFVAGGSYKDIVLKFRPDAIQPGKLIMNKTGATVGEHNGVVGFTIGQRRGINISHPEPLYVIKIDALSRCVYIGTKDELAENKVHVKQVNWIGSPEYQAISYDNDVIDCVVKLRSLHSGSRAKVRFLSDKMNECIVTLEDPYHAISPGQACVFYKEDICLGGGFISRAS